MITNNLNLNVNIQYQKTIWFIIPLLPIFLIFFIGSVAETNRAPFDLAEAESELVSGFMTEHAAVIFVFFFLAEYSSILLMCILSSILFIGGYLIGFDILYFFTTDKEWFNLYLTNNNIINISAIFYSLTLGLKSSIMVFIFIWVRASFPRIRFDQLMSFCWTILLPIVFAFIILIPCILYDINILINNIELF